MNMIGFEELYTAAENAKAEILKKSAEASAAQGTALEKLAQIVHRKAYKKLAVPDAEEIAKYLEGKTSTIPTITYDSASKEIDAYTAAAATHREAIAAESEASAAFKDYLGFEAKIGAEVGAKGIVVKKNPSLAATPSLLGEADHFIPLKDLATAEGLAKHAPHIEPSLVPKIGEAIKDGRITMSETFLKTVGKIEAAAPLAKALEEGKGLGGFIRRNKKLSITAGVVALGAIGYGLFHKRESHVDTLAAEQPSAYAGRT